MIELKKGDCLELIKDIPDGSVDLVLTDPPYGISYKTNHRKDKHHDFCSVIQNDENAEMFLKLTKEIFRVMKENSGGFVFACWKNFGDFFYELKNNGFHIKNIIIWDKGNWTAGDLKGAFGSQYEIVIFFTKGRPLIRGKRYSDIWRFKRVVGLKQVHQNQKPVELLERAIQAFSDENDTILDCFMGSGSTGVACVNTGRNFIGIELDDHYFSIAKERIEKAQR